ncbi:tetratricopeptide repeat protein [Paenibacillus lentus]|uniref:J domain-containing protein n=1 Tax=Paenibacillus lentus TaxID=1338368 RepID=UPI003656DCA2
MAEPFMTNWQRLGIDPTNDIKMIKRAYAKQLQIYHPEDDAEGYQALREAYDRALKIAKQHGLKKDFIELKDIEQEELQEQVEQEGQEEQEEQAEHAEGEHPEEDARAVILPPRLPVELHIESLESEPDEPEAGCQTVDEFIGQAIALYDHFPSRISSNAWVELLNTKVTWNIFNKEEISERLLEVLETRRFLPQEIWKLLEGFFGWKFEMKERWSEYEHPKVYRFLEYYTKQLDEPGLQYESLLAAGDIDFDQFLGYRYKGYQALMANDLKEAGKYLEQASNLFGADPDLLLLLGEYYERTGKIEAALEAYEGHIRMAPGELDGYFGRARMRFQQGKYAPAAEDYQLLLSRAPRRMEARLLLGHCWLKLRQNDKAKDCFKKVIDQAEPASIEEIQALNGLAIVHPEYVWELYKEKRQAARQQKVRNRRNFWKHTCVLAAMILSFGWFIFSVFNGIGNREPIHITNLKELEKVRKGSYVSLSLTDVQDLDLGQYELDTDKAKPKVVIQARSVAERHLEDYGFPKSYIYTGSFRKQDQQDIIFLSKKWLSDAAASEGDYSVTVTGYIHRLASTDIESAAFQVIQRLPGDTEKPQSFYAKYIEESSQHKPSLLNRTNIFTFGLILYFFTWHLRLRKAKKRILANTIKERTSLWSEH